MELLQQCNSSSHVALALLDGNKDWIWVGPCPSSRRGSTMAKIALVKLRFMDTI
jgi:hypothetical protein